MVKHPLDMAFAKLEHARRHSDTLRAAVRTFLSTTPYHLESRLNEQQTEEVWSIVVDPIPQQIECMVADAVHNIRTPLDKMLAADFPNTFIHTAGANIRQICFPISSDQANLETRLAKLKDHVTSPVIEFLRSIDSHTQSILWATNELDNQDKHRALLEPVKTGFSTASFGELKTTDGFLLRMGSPRGKHMLPVPDARPGAWHMQQSLEHLKPVAKAHPLQPGKICLEFTSPYNDMEVFTTTPGTTPCFDIIPSLSLAFSNLPCFEDTPSDEVLELMLNAVSFVLTEYKRAFF